MKQLEDIRVEHQKISEEHSQLLTSKKEDLFKRATIEFSHFFQGKGFTYVNEPSKLSATYKELRVIVRFPNPSDNFIGAYSVFNLSVSTPSKEYQITVNEVGVYPRSVQVETAYGTAFQDKIDEIDKEIKKLSGEIENMKTHAESFRKSNLGFTLHNEDKSKAVDKQFLSMKELLTELFN
jgi:hypothetical protein